jgi:cytochrome c553
MKIDAKKAFVFVCGTAAAILFAGTVSLISSRPADAAGDVQAGKAKAAACAGCHGADGQGVAPNPALAGKKEDQLIQALKDYKSGKRDNAVMKGMASSLNDQDIANVAAYFASLK